MTRSRNEAVPQGTNFAEFFSFGSRTLKLLPPLNHLIVGNNNVPAGWQVLRTMSSSDIVGPSDWVRFEGDPKGSRLPIPRLAKTAGIIAVEAAEMEELRTRHPEGQDAVALMFDEAVVIGALGKGVQFDSTAKKGEELVAAGILRGDLAAIAGRTSWPVHRTGNVDLIFNPAETSQFEWRGPMGQLASSTPLV